MHEPHGLRGLRAYVWLTAWQFVAVAALVGLGVAAQPGGPTWPTILAAGTALPVVHGLWHGQTENIERIGLETMSDFVQVRLLPAAWLWWAATAAAGLVATLVPAARGSWWLAAPLLAGLATAVAALACAVAAVVVWTHARRDLARASAIVTTMRAVTPARELARVEAWIGWQTGEGEDPPARIRGAYFPGLSQRPWRERGEFPWVPMLEAETSAILAEVRSAAVRFENEAYLNSSTRTWRAGYLTRRFLPVPENRARVPYTSALVDRITGGVARDVMISRLGPGGFIQSHRDPGNIFLTCHLALEVPPDCGLHLAGETRTWSEGQCMVFDSSYRHHAFNRGEGTRMVLLFDFLNPELTAVEQEFFRRFFARPA